MNFWKVIQKQIYNFLSQKYYVAGFILLVLTTLLSLVHLCEVWLHRSWSVNDQLWFNNFMDNLGNHRLHVNLTQYLPVDVVYTWVNGSDPLFRSQLADYRRTLALTSSVECPYANCLPSNFIAARLVGNGVDSLSGFTDFSIVKSKMTAEKWKLVSLDSPESAANRMADGESGVHHAHWTTDGSLMNIYSSNDTILFQVPCNYMHKISRSALRSWLKDSVKTFWIYKNVCKVVVQLKMAAVLILKGKPWSILHVDGMRLNLTAAHLLLELPTKMKRSDYETSRYDDKEELRYSLRSLEMYAPWVRKVFLVTNGQIPNWLELENPKLSLITHSMIFPNNSHLPTFSSPAIETHLHRIPGLSQKFLYMNDDILFGDHVLPEDFISQREGQKVYLSWPIPDCSNSCPWSWVKDGACDLPCNVSTCAYDGGDCLPDDDETDQSQLAAFYAENHDYDPDQQLEETRKKRSAENNRNGTEEEMRMKETVKKQSAESSNQKKTEESRSILDKSVDIYSNITSTRLFYNDIFPYRHKKCRYDYYRRSTNSSVSFSLVISECRYLRYMRKLKMRIMFGGSSDIHSRFRRDVSNSTVPKNLGKVIEGNGVEKENNDRINYNNQIKSSAKARAKELGKQFLYNNTERPRKLDTYAESLLHVNALFNNKYGFKRRKVPAHMPLLIDRTIINELQKTFFDEFQQTSSRKIRSPNDMQFAFSYFYYLMSEETHMSVEQIFDHFDTDKSGTWSDREIRTLLTRLFPLPLQRDSIVWFEQALINCAQKRSPASAAENSITPMYERYLGSVLPLIQKSLVIECKDISNMLRKKFGAKKRFPHVVMQHQETVGFYMVGSNLSDLLLSLDSIRSKPKKFICLNDNMDASRVQDNEIVKAALIDFYHSLFPRASQFELSSEYVNRFLYYDDYLTWRQHHNFVSNCITVAVVIIGGAAFVAIFKNELRWLLKRLNKLWKGEKMISRKRSNAFHVRTTHNVVSNIT